MIRDAGRYVMRNVLLPNIRVLALSIWKRTIMGRPSRKKFQEALRALKAACKNDRLPFTLRVHAAELIMCAYGVELPQASGRIKKTVKQLVEESAFERKLREQVREKIQDAETDARAFLERLSQGQHHEHN
jgi:hypothetical protein